MTNSLIFIAFGAFFLKHFIVDFLLQPRWMYANKHLWGHPGGLAHAALHGITTASLLYMLLLCGAAGAGILQLSVAISIGWLIAILLGGLDSSVHYIVDWAKMNLNLYMGWTPNTTERFWYLLGFDQLLHYLTYVMILYIWWS